MKEVKCSTCIFIKACYKEVPYQKRLDCTIYEGVKDEKKLH